MAKWGFPRVALGQLPMALGQLPMALGQLPMALGQLPMALALGQLPMALCQLSAKNRVNQRIFMRIVHANIKQTLEMDIVYANCL